jgi:alanine racemase
VKSWIEISGERLKENLRALQAVVGAEAEVLPVIKANGYGHGAELIAPVLADAGARWLGVGDAEEGERVRGALRLRNAEDRTRLLMMSGMEPEDAGAVVEHGLTPVVWTRRQVRALEAAAAQAGVHVAVHLEIDSGMARQGAAPGAELAEVLQELKQAPRVRCEGVFSHLSSSEVRGSEQTKRQMGRFGSAVEQIWASDVIPEWIHLANSSALDEGSTTEWVRQRAREGGARVLVRPGLAVYGYCLPMENTARPGELGERLRPVLAWKTRVIATREIAMGQTVGYGATFVAQQPMRLALLPVGYADGLRREASSGVGDGWVMIAGQRAPVVGRVSMNLTTVDVSGIANVSEGDEVTVLGEGVTAEDHARWCGTISYEVLCGIKAHGRLV